MLIEMFSFIFITPSLVVHSTSGGALRFRIYEKPKGDISILLKYDIIILL